HRVGLPSLPAVHRWFGLASLGSLGDPRVYEGSCPSVSSLGVVLAVGGISTSVLSPGRTGGRTFGLAPRTLDAIASLLAMGTNTYHSASAVVRRPRVANHRTL